MRREELLAVEVIARDKAMKAKAAKAAGVVRKPVASLFSLSSLLAMFLLLAGIASFVAVMMKGNAS